MRNSLESIRRYFFCLPNRNYISYIQTNGLPVFQTRDPASGKAPKKIDAYFAWVKNKYSQITHNSTVGKALTYSINPEKYLRIFLTDGNIPPDNNYTEQAIRPFTIGRKNFVLIETDNGTRTSAMLYSITETAKANGLNTYQYLELLLTELPKHVEDKNLQFLDTLLPCSDRVQKECPGKFKKS